LDIGAVHGLFGVQKRKRSALQSYIILVMNHGRQAFFADRLNNEFFIVQNDGAVVAAVFLRGGNAAVMLLPCASLMRSPVASTGFSLLIA
jgi:hypothetical protein